MYHVLSIGFTSVLLYLISYFFYRIGYFNLQFHRKFWNLILAITFILTMLAGLFLALQISYKWNIPFIRTILKWHVEFGIGMSFSGLFHFIWHFGYFRKFFIRQEYIKENYEIHGYNPSVIRNNILIIGVISSSVQFLLMRELMNITGGYELIAGSFLASWLISSAIGSFLAGKSKLSDLRKINLSFLLSLIISLILMFTLSRVFLNQGETPSLLTSVIYTFLVLLPFCISSGFIFVRMISIAGSESNTIPGKCFSIETTGGILAGILTSALTAGHIGTYKMLTLIVLMSFSYLILGFYKIKNTSRIAFKLIVIVLAITTVISDPDIIFRKLMMPGVNVTGSYDTPYGNITKGLYTGEESIYYNQRLLAFRNDVAEREEDIHYAMLQSDSPEKVLLISGSFGSHLSEILKYPVKKITYVERDPSLVALEISSAEKSAGKATIINRDAYSFIRNSSEPYDVIILLLPPPSTLMLNKYYTTEFFREIRKKLDKDGVFLCSPGPGEDYFNKESIKLYSSIYNSLSGVFRNIEPVIGNKLYFIASDKQLSLSFCRMVENKNIQNLYVNKNYLDDSIIAKKSNDLILLIDRKAPDNRSAFPIACMGSQSYRFSMTIGEKVPVLIIMIILFVLPLFFIKRNHFIMYFSASALAGFEIIALMTLQLIVGNMYQLNGLIIASLMAGLSVGSGIKLSVRNNFHMEYEVILLAVFFLIFGLTYNYMLELRNDIISTALIMVAGFLPAFLTGSLFRKLTSRNDGVTISPVVYSADLAGSALGFILISGYVIPAFGIKISTLLLSALILAGLFFGTITSKK